VSQNSTSCATSSSSVPGALSRYDPLLLQQAKTSGSVCASSTQKSFMLRKMHSYGDDCDGSVLMDTVPMLDHLDDDDNSTCNDDSFWDAYYEANLASVDFNDKQKDFQESPEAQLLDSQQVLASYEGKMRDIQQNLEKDPSVERVVCSSSLCLVRVEETELLI